MEDIDRIILAKNRVFQAGFAIGKDNPIALNTDSNHLYRVTGQSQIEDIIECGFVRPPANKSVGGHVGEVFWTQGGSNLYYYDRRPVLETSAEVLKENGQIGAISLDMLTGIWIFDEQQNKYVNQIQAIRDLFSQKHSIEDQITELKTLIAAYDEQIQKQVAMFQPFLHIPGISQEIAKLTARIEVINSSQISDSLNNYKVILGLKQEILDRLIQINKIIQENNYGIEETVEEQIAEPQPGV
ncbi:MAG: hypothetical protein K6B70_03475 [Clostridia bacterium]|nr:hypothetical protein [Clostridia bacterium]